MFCADSPVNIRNRTFILRPFCAEQPTKVIVVSRQHVSIIGTTLMHKTQNPLKLVIVPACIALLILTGCDASTGSGRGHANVNPFAGAAGVPQGQTSTTEPSTQQAATSAAP